MSRLFQDHLHKTIEALGYGLKADWDAENVRGREKVRVGPNSWDEVQPEDFGPYWDYELYDHGDMTVFYPVSKAALQWCYKHLPEDLDRWGDKGFKIETAYITLVTKAADSDKLMSEQEYNDAMEEANAIQHQGVEE